MLLEHGRVAELMERNEHEMESAASRAMKCAASQGLRCGVWCGCRQLTAAKDPDNSLMVKQAKLTKIIGRHFKCVLLYTEGRRVRPLYFCAPLSQKYASSRLFVQHNSYFSAK